MNNTDSRIPTERDIGLWSNTDMAAIRVEQRETSLRHWSHRMQARNAALSSVCRVLRSRPRVQRPTI